MRSLAALLAVALLRAAPVPSPVPAAASTDRVAQLMGTWSCRNGYGLTSKLTYQPDAGGFVSTRVAASPIGRKGTFTRRFRRDPDGGWLVDTVTRKGTTSEPVPAWTSDTWSVKTAYGMEWYAFANADTLQVSDADGGPIRLREICLRGETPPPPSTCITPELPTVVWQAVEPDIPPLAQQQGIQGDVHVRVSLDAGSRVVGTSITSSPSAILNNSALAAARQSRYLTARHECKPVPSEYDFVVQYVTR